MDGRMEWVEEKKREVFKKVLISFKTFCHSRNSNEALSHHDNGTATVFGILVHDTQHTDHRTNSLQIYKWKRM